MIQILKMNFNLQKNRNWNNKLLVITISLQVYNPQVQKI